MNASEAMMCQMALTRRSGGLVSGVFSDMKNGTRTMRVPFFYQGYSVFSIRLMTVATSARVAAPAGRKLPSSMPDMRPW